MMTTMTRRFYYDISKSKRFGIVLSLQLFKFNFRCIDNIGSVVATFLKECHEATGFAWQLVGGGLDKSGEIKVVMYAMSVFLIQHFLMLMIGVLLAKRRMIKNSKIPIQIGNRG